MYIAKFFFQKKRMNFSRSLRDHLNDKECELDLEISVPSWERSLCKKNASHLA